MKRKICEKEKDFVSKKKKQNDSLSHHALHATTNEINVLKNKMDCLSSTLSSCAFNHNRLESLFSKKQTPHIHAHHPHHAYDFVARHDHTNTHKHNKVYVCTHCGRKGHLTKFCFDKLHVLNFANKDVWVPYKTNPKGPKRKWVPKSPPLIFEVQVLTKHERDGALMVDAHGLDGHIY